MKNLSIKTNGRLIAAVFSAALFTAIWYAGEAASKRAAALPVLPAPQVRSVPAIPAPKDYYPLWAKQAAVVVQEGGDVDGAFVAPPPPPPAAPAVAPVDVAALVRLAATQRVTGAGDAGMTIGGEFVAVGRPVVALAQMDGAGASVVPVLEAAGMDEIRLAVGKQKVVVRLSGV